MGRRTSQGERSAAHILVVRCLNVASWISCRVGAKSEGGVGFGVGTFSQRWPLLQTLYLSYTAESHNKERRFEGNDLRWTAQRGGGSDS